MCVPFVVVNGFMNVTKRSRG